MDSGVVRMTTYIQLPKNHENVEFWTNPSYYVSSNIWITHNTLQTRFRSIEANKTAQQILIIPKSQFNTTINANVVNIDAKDVYKRQIKNKTQRINVKICMLFWSIQNSSRFIPHMEKHACRNL